MFEKLKKIQQHYFFDVPPVSKKKPSIQRLVPFDMDRVRYVNLKTGDVFASHEISLAQVMSDDFKTFYLLEEMNG